MLSIMMLQGLKNLAAFFEQSPPRGGQKTI